MQNLVIQRTRLQQLLMRTLREVLGVDDGAILCWVAGFSLLAVPVVMQMFPPIANLSTQRCGVVVTSGSEEFVVSIAA